MLIKLRQHRAQSTLEYAILIGIIAAGLIAMQVYLKRGFQGKVRDNTDQMGEQFEPGETYVYEHRKLDNEAKTKENVYPTGFSKSELITDQIRVKTQDSREEVSPVPK